MQDRIESIEAIPISIPRDRTMLDKEALAELEHSISTHGIRLPIEVYEMQTPVGGKRFRPVAHDPGNQ